MESDFHKSNVINLKYGSISVTLYKLPLTLYKTYMCVCLCVAVPQVLDAMSDSTTSSTIANDLDLIYLKGIMESPQV